MSRFLVGGAALAVQLGLVGHLSAQETEGAAPALALAELTLCKGVDNGQAIDPTSTFQANGESVYALVRVDNPSRAETLVRVTFARADADAATLGQAGVTLTIAGRPRVRTVARTSAQSLGAGQYKVIVRDATGAVLGEAPFTVE